MCDSLSRQPLFAGLVYNEEGEPAAIEYVGDTPCYVVLDADFRRYVESEKVDRSVLDVFREQIFSHHELVTEKILEMLGRDDIFTKAMIDASIRNMDQLLDRGLPEDARNLLGMVGFRVIVDYHGDVVEVKLPGQEGDWDEDE